MGILVLVLLVAAWGLVLGPALLKNSKEPSPMQTEKVFNRALRALGGQRRPKQVPGGRWVLVPPSAEYPPSQTEGPRRSTAADRRRRNLSYLASFIIVTFLLGLLRPLRPLLVVNLVADVLLIAYLVAVLVFAARPLKVRPNAGAGEELRPPA